MRRSWVKVRTQFFIWFSLKRFPRYPLPETRTNFSTPHIVPMVSKMKIYFGQTDTAEIIPDWLFSTIFAFKIQLNYLLRPQRPNLTAKRFYLSTKLDRGLLPSAIFLMTRGATQAFFFSAENRFRSNAWTQQMPFGGEKQYLEPYLWPEDLVQNTVFLPPWILWTSTVWNIFRCIFT